jgi:hypothetical protein
MVLSGQDRRPAIFALALLVGLGAVIARCVVGEIRRLDHWGEPVLTASATGLTLVKRGRTVGWDDVIAVTPERRGVRIRLQTRLSRASGRDIFIPTRRPQALAAAILGDEALKRLR